MSIHSYSRCWLHCIWGTRRRERIITKSTAAKVSNFLNQYGESKGIYVKINYVNPDHVHILIDLPTKYSIEEAAKLFKGASSHWINQNRLTIRKFAWSRGYGAFSVSESNVESVAKYIGNQKEHHRKRTFKEEYEKFIRAYKLQWNDDDEEENR